MSIEVNKCALCGKLFHSLGTKICAPCSDQADHAYREVREYLYSAEDQVTLNDILQNTDASEKVVKYLIKEGRISPKGIKDAGQTSCIACGVPIEKGRLCSKCSSVWSEQLHKQDDQGTDGNKLKTGIRMYTRQSK